MNQTLNGIAPLPHLGMIRVQGEDAATFLQGQLTQDFALLGMSEARLAGFCSAKGRMQASFIGFKRSPTDILLVCSRDLLPQTLKRHVRDARQGQIERCERRVFFARIGWRCY
jgi:folate-binding Fe-S cluster repair protein YgfZ